MTWHDRQDAKTDLGLIKLNDIFSFIQSAAGPTMVCGQNSRGSTFIWQAVTEEKLAMAPFGVDDQ